MDPQEKRKTERPLPLLPRARRRSSPFAIHRQGFNLISDVTIAADRRSTVGVVVNNTLQSRLAVARTTTELRLGADNVRFVRQLCLTCHFVGPGVISYPPRNGHPRPR